MKAQSPVSPDHTSRQQRFPDFQTTKQNVLRKVATIFDPLGFVFPYVIVAKILLQELWMRGYDWDDEVQDEIANKIGDWFEQLKSLKEVKIPRCLRRPEPVKSKRIVVTILCNTAWSPSA